MGQYYQAINIDKKQVMGFDGIKMMEFSWLGNESVQSLIGMMMGAWKGDRVFVVGDYADGERGGENDDPWLSTYQKIAREFGLERATYIGKDGREYALHLYQLAQREFEDVTPDAYKLAEQGGAIRYIINRELGVFIDLEHCPCDEVTYGQDKDGSESTFAWRVHPLTLVLAMGNGRGMGDYRGGYTPFVDCNAKKHEARTTCLPIGAWAETTQHITFAKAGEEAQLEGLREWEPEFAEKDDPIGWQDIPAAEEKALKNGRKMAARTA